MGLKRITEEYAQGLIKADDDLTGAEAVYFTITPSANPQLASEGYEDVTYYTNRPKKIQIPKGMVGSQWVYVLTNFPSITAKACLLTVTIYEPLGLSFIKDLTDFFLATSLPYSL